MTNRADYQRHYRQKYKDHAKRVNLTFSREEYRGIARAAEAAGQPVAAYVKSLAVSAHNGTGQLPEATLEQLAELDRVIRTIANNVNQIARHSHRIGRVLDEQEVFLHLHRLQQELHSTLTRAASKPEDSPASSDEGGT